MRIPYGFNLTSSRGALVASAGIDASSFQFGFFDTKSLHISNLRRQKFFTTPILSLDTYLQVFWFYFDPQIVS